MPLLAARPAVAALQGGQRGAGGAVGLGRTGASLAGRVACWEVEERDKEREKRVKIRQKISGNER